MNTIVKTVAGQPHSLAWCSTHDEPAWIDQTGSACCWHFDRTGHLNRDLHPIGPCDIGPFPPPDRCTTTEIEGQLNLLETERPRMTLFDPAPLTIGPDLTDLGRDARRTIRNRATLAGGRHPVTGLQLLDPRWEYSCADCAHLTANRPTNRTYWKCDLNATRGAATDLRKSWPACTRLRIKQGA